MSNAPRLSLRFAMLAMLAAGIVVSTAGTGLLWQQHSETALTDLGTQLRTQLLHRATDKLHNHLGSPKRANRVLGSALDHGLDATDATRTSEQMLDILDTLRPDFVQIGFPEGGFIGAERLPSGEPRLLFTEGQVAGELSSYGVEPDGTLGERIETLPYDSRVRPWFRSAVEAREQAWSPIYVIVTPPLRLGITLGEPTFDDQGRLEHVVASDLIVSSFSQFLAELDLGIDGRIAVFDADGLFVATSTGEAVLRLVDGEATRVRGVESADPVLAAAAAHLSTGAPEGRSLVELSHDWLFEVEVNGERYLTEAAPLHVDGLSWLVVVAVPESAVLGSVQRSARDTLGLSALGLLFALGLGVLVNRRITEPLDRVALDLQRVARFELDPAPPSHTPFTELAAIEDATERMKRGLRSFERYVSSDLVRSLIRHNREATLGVEPVAVTVFFSDIEGFTGLAERLEPDHLVEIVGGYLGEWSNLILFSGGTVDKFIGDAIMAFWNAPEPVDDHPATACDVALACQERLEALNQVWGARGLPPVHSRIGLHTDTALVGNLGSTQRMDYTVVGDGVNLASRIEGLNKRYGTSILISEDVRIAVEDAFVSRPVDRVRVKGRTQPTTVHELVARRAQATEAQLAHCEAARAAFALYLDRQFADAEAAFGRLAEDGDEAANLLRARCGRLMLSAPGAEWDGTSEAANE